MGENIHKKSLQAREQIDRWLVTKAGPKKLKPKLAVGKS